MLCQLYFRKAGGGGDQMEGPLQENDLTGGHGDLEIEGEYLLQGSPAAFCGMVEEGQLYGFEPVPGVVIQIPLPPHWVAMLNPFIQLPLAHRPYTYLKCGAYRHHLNLSHPRYFPLS